MTKKCIEFRVWLKEDARVDEIEEVALQFQDHIIDMVGENDISHLFDQDVTYVIVTLLEE